LTTVRRLSGHYSEVVEQQSENGLALVEGPTQALRVVMEDGTGAAALEAAARLLIEFVGGEFHEETNVLAGKCGWPAGRTKNEVGSAITLRWAE